MSIAKTPEPPYYAVIFTSVQSADTEGYPSMAKKMVKLAAEQPGYLGVESAREGTGITWGSRWLLVALRVQQPILQALV